MISLYGNTFIQNSTLQSYSLDNMKENIEICCDSIIKIIEPLSDTGCHYRIEKVHNGTTDMIFVYLLLKVTYQVE